MRSIGLLESVAIAAWLVAPATRPAMAQPADIASEAEAILAAAYRDGEPGAAAIVMKDGQVLWSGGRGLADIESGRPIAPDTVFRIGSITKQFTAAVVLQLVAEGKLSLDDPLSRFFPDWPQPGARATVRQLLNHTSGLPEFTAVPGYMGSEATMRPVTTADLVAVIRGRPSPSEPGQRWQYNNSGYVLLGAIVEQLTGKAWHEAVAERLTRPLGLSTIGYGPATETDPARARPYIFEGGGFTAARGVHMSVGHAAGALVGSVGDLARWTQALHHGRVVSPELYREMTAPGPLAGGGRAPYGFGLHLIEYRGQPAFRHGGAAAGVDTGSIYVPAEDLFVAVLSNTNSLDSSVTVQRLVALAMGNPFPNLARADVPLAAIEPLFGAYRAESGPDLVFFNRDGKLYLARGDDETEAFAAGDDRFFFGPNDLVWFRFARPPGAAPAIEVHRPDGTVVRAARAGEVPPAVSVPPEVLRSYAGTYATEGPVLTIALAADGRLTVAPAGQEAFPMRPVSPTEFRVEGAPMRIVFHPENGAVDRLTLNRGPRELHGTRTAP